MREWWVNLAVREKQAVMIGGLFLMVFIVYQGLWSPLVTRVVTLRSQLEQNQKLLAWMQLVDATIQKLEKKTQGKNPDASPVSMLSFLQKQINQALLNENLTQLKQGASETIEMHFQKVEFDKLMSLLAQTVAQGKMTITTMSVTASEKPGLVDASIVVK